MADLQTSSSKNGGGRTSSSVQGNKTLHDAIDELQQLPEQQPNASEYNTILVVAESAAQYRTSLFCGLLAHLGAITAETFDLPLSQLAIPSANEVIPRDTPEGGGSVVKRLTSTPGAIFVIVDSNGFICVFVNSNLGGGDAWSLLGEALRNGKAVQLPCGVGHRKRYKEADFGANGLG
ncbi:hypothetical protein [Candidatus Amarolinea dominans]|uniref:hypothetical protein n=1 Tax=Candidatus Amarolinea dominans TaxID=3140696 RepID=UPI001DEB63DC|nr:hypothetical protein [Anaerolineae bacterium]